MSNSFDTMYMVAFAVFAFATLNYTVEVAVVVCLPTRLPWTSTDNEFNRTFWRCELDRKIAKCEVDFRMEST